MAILSARRVVTIVFTTALYLSGTHARDKDAVVASMLFAEMACYYTYKKVSLYDKLNSLFDKFGYFVESSKSIAFKGLDYLTIVGKILLN